MHRLDLYQRLSQTRTDEEIFEIYEQIQEYHGQAPEEVAFLIEVMLIRLRLKGLGVSALSSRFDPGEIKIGLTLLKKANIDSARFAVMLQAEPAKIWTHSFRPALFDLGCSPTCRSARAGAYGARCTERLAGFARITGV